MPLHFPKPEHYIVFFHWEVRESVSGWLSRAR
jgi:hypothetical protein